MGSPAAMLLTAAPATNVPAGAQAEAAPLEGGDFLAALMASAPVAAPQAEGLPKRELPSSDTEGSGESPASELAAAIAAMLVSVSPAGDATADSGSGGDAGTDAATALQMQDGESSADPDAALNRLLQSLSQRLASSMTAANADAAANPASGNTVAAQPADAALVPLLSPARTAEAAAAALVAAARLPEPSSIEAPAQPSAQTIVSTMASTMGPAAQPQAANAAAAPTLHAPVGTPRWSEELGARMMLMRVNGQHEGSLTLTPEHLGPLEVRLSVNQGTTNVWFGSQHADTRAALTEALPRLREMFADAGLSLGHAGVSHEAPRQGREAEAARFAGSSAGEITEGTEVVARTSHRVLLGLVDTYA
jgi:flagellar hook-length control protein FliK